MSTGYSWEGIRQVRATLLGARHVPERLCGGYVYLWRYIKCSTFTFFTFLPGGGSAARPNSARRVQSPRFHEAADQDTIFAARHTKMARKIQQNKKTNYRKKLKR